MPVTAIQQPSQKKEKCIYKKEVKTKRDLEDGILNAKWSTIDIPLIKFNHFDVLDRIYFDNKMSDDKMPDDINTKDILYKTPKLQKIREGIRNGTIVKEYKPDGTYIWKKVKK